MGVAIWVTNPRVFLLGCALCLGDTFLGQHISRDALWQWHSRLPLKRRCGKSQKTQPLQTVRFREKGRGCGTSQFAHLALSGKQLA